MHDLALPQFRLGRATAATTMPQAAAFGDAALENNADGC
jgi:hypothetical protein